jgi:hypothetical protein
MNAMRHMAMMMNPNLSQELIFAAMERETEEACRRLKLLGEEAVKLRDDLIAGGKSVIEAKLAAIQYIGNNLWLVFL